MIEYFVRSSAACGADVGRRDSARRFRAKAECASAASPPPIVVGPIAEGVAESARGLRARRQRRRRAVQVHRHQSLHARAHVARRALPRFPEAHAGDRRCARGAGCRPAVRLRAGGRGEHPRQSGRRPARRRSHQPRARRRPGREGGPLLLRQLRRADHSRGEWNALIRSSTVCTPIISCSNSRIARRPISMRCRTWIPRIGVGLGVVDVKVNHIETPDEIARRHRARRKGARAGPRAVHASGLRLLDAEALGGRSQDRRAGQGTGFVSRPPDRASNSG